MLNRGDMTKYEITYSLLKDLKRAGYEMVTIGRPDGTNPACKNWMNGPESLWCYHNTFKGMYNDDREKCGIQGWPAVWELARKYGMHGGCGNGHQVQIKFNSSVIRGTYDLRKSMVHIKKKFNVSEEEEFLEKIS